MAAALVPGRGRVDLHTHSALSDGTVNPDDLVAQALRLGLKWLAVADHDTTTSLARCVSAASATGLNFIPAIEITSANPANGNPLHLLGYGLRLESAEWLNAALSGVRQARTDWQRRSVEKLRAVGYEVTWSEVWKHAKGGDVHKAHVVHALADAGYTTRFKGSLYRRLSEPGAPLAGHTAYITPDLAIDLIHESGGVAVLAHPGIAGAIASCDALVGMGLDGIEAFHPSHTAQVVEQALSLARKHGLVVMGGSDYHGLYSDFDTTLGCPELTFGHIDDLLGRIRAIGKGVPA